MNPLVRTSVFTVMLKHNVFCRVSVQTKLNCFTLIQSWLSKPSYRVICTALGQRSELRATVPDPGKGVCADPVNRGAILEGEGPGPPSGDKERQLSPDRGRGKTWQNEDMAGSQGRLPLHGFRMLACTERVHVHSPRRKCLNIFGNIVFIVSIVSGK
jgi:hypothetical protein